MFFNSSVSRRWQRCIKNHFFNCGSSKRSSFRSSCGVAKGQDTRAENLERQMRRRKVFARHGCDSHFVSTILPPSPIMRKAQLRLAHHRRRRRVPRICPVFFSTHSTLVRRLFFLPLAGIGGIWQRPHQLVALMSPRCCSTRALPLPFNPMASS